MATVREIAESLGDLHQPSVESATAPSVEPAPAPEPPMVLSRELMEPFIEEALKRPYREGRNLNEATPKAIQERFEEAVYHLLDKGETWAISEIGLGAVQLHALILQSKERGK